MGNETEQHTLTEKQFCEIYTQFRGVEIDKVAQLKYCSFTGEELFEFLSFAAKSNELRIKELDAQLEQRWISVEDGLPKENVSVLCAHIPKQPVMEGRIVSILKRIWPIPVGSMRGLFDDNGFGNTSRVTHWQPLPPLTASIKDRGEKQ